MWELVTALRSDGQIPIPQVFEDEQLAQHWHCTPAVAREQPENDRIVAMTWINAHTEAARQESYFSAQS